MDCFGTYFTHVQTCNVTRVQSATEWTASVHTLHMSKPVMYPVFKVLRNVYWASGSPYGGLKGGVPSRRVSGTFRGLQGGFLKGLPGTFSGGTLRRGFKVPSESLRQVP